MSETTADEAFVATFKSGKGYDAAWLVLRASDPVQLNQRLGAVTDELLHRISQVNRLFQAIDAAEATVGPTTLAGASSAQSAAPSTAPAQAAQSAPPQPVQSLPHDSNVVPFQQPQQPAPAPQANVQYSPNGTVCSKCGERLYYQEGVSQKTGKPWKAYKCGGRGFGHDAEWVR